MSIMPIHLNVIEIAFWTRHLFFVASSLATLGSQFRFYGNFKKRSNLNP